MSVSIEEMIDRKYIRPTQRKRKQYIGVEIELPVVNLSGEASRHEVSQDALAKMVERFAFSPVKYDENGVCHEASDPVTGDIFSFDCSYNNFEISFGKEECLGAVDRRFRQYVAYLDGVLTGADHIVTGMGIHPYYRSCEKDFVPTGRYKMLEGYLNSFRTWNKSGFFHGYPGYPTYASASQVQLDVECGELTETIRVFSLLEPVKSVLFANSLMTEDEPELLCARDMLWENSTHGINPHNIGMYETYPESVGELVEYIASTCIFCAERGDHYMFFYPVPISEYLKREKLEGEYFRDGAWHKESFEPCEEDIKYLRTYKFVDLTARGTLEFRSACTQPLSEALSAAAFQLGLMEEVEELGELLREDTALYHHGFSAAELRRMMNRNRMPDFVDENKLRSLVLETVKLSERGLKKRGYGEEEYLRPVFDRAERLCSPGRQMRQMLDDGVEMAEIVQRYAQL